MPRPPKRRRVCGLPTTVIFSPGSADTAGQLDLASAQIELTVDEYETLRLIDLLDLTQEECALQMNVARTTVQSIYDRARKKTADALVNGKSLLISGGAFDVCLHGKSCCRKNCGSRNCEQNRCEQQNKIGEQTMKIAVTYDQGQVFQHFGHSENFKIYDVEDGKITSSAVINAAGSGHGALAGFLKGNGVDALICGGIGGGARTALAEAGIQLYPGVTGDADENLQALLDGQLQYNPDTVCSHHHGEGGHGGEGHSCGEHKHGCSSHS